MKTRWLVLSLALVAVAALAAVVFSSQPGETSHGVSRGIILWVLDWLHLEVSEEFAASDELHQFYTGNRTASPGDVLLDSVGLAAGCAAAWFLRRCWEKRHT